MYMIPKESSARVDERLVLVPPTRQSEEVNPEKPSNDRPSFKHAAGLNISQTSTIKSYSLAHYWWLLVLIDTSEASTK